MKREGRERVLENRLIREIEHGKKIVHAAGEIWNWETTAGKLRWTRRAKMLTNHISQEHRVLELGCGIGYFTKELAKTGAEIHAIDISSELLQRAICEVHSCNVTFKIDNAYQTSFDDAMFDTIVGSSVLHHLEIKKALSECYRLLKPGGSIVFTEPNMLNPQIAVQKNIPFIKKRLGDSPDETAFFKWQMRKMLLKEGFKEICVEAFDFLHPSIPKQFVKIVERIGLTIEKIPLLKEFAGSLYIYARK